MSAVQPIPEGFRSVTPGMVIKNAAEALDFYQKAFGAEVMKRLNGPGGAIMHAEIRVGDSMIMISDEWPGHHVQSPKTNGGTSITLHVYVKDVDAAHKRAVEAGAVEKMPAADMFWGDRYSAVVDPYGHAWSIGTHIKDMTEEECQQAADAWMAEMAKSGQGPCE